MRIRMLVLSLLLCMIVQSAAAGQRQSYIVQTEPRSSGNSETDVDAEAAYYQQMVSEAMQFSAELQGIAVEKAAVEESKIFHVYRTVMNGFAAKLTPEEVKYLESLPHVTGVYRERIMQVETTHTPELLGLNQLQGLWPESNYGEGVIVGMIDSGVYPESPSFSDHLMTPVPARWKGSCIPGVNFTVANCNKKIIGARYYYKGYEADVAPLNWTEHCKSARDTEGHGTHTSSTAIGRWAYGASVFGFANGTATGMAPRAHVAAYKVCWAGACAGSDILAAYDDAVADGVDVISFSIGSSIAVDYFADTIAIGTFGAMKRGIFVSAAAGNGGPGPYTVRNVAPWITTVGAATVDREFYLDAALGDGKIVRGQSMYAGKPLATGKTPLIVGTGAALSNGSLDAAGMCFAGSLNATLVKGKVVLCWRGITGRVEKGVVVKQAGGVGMILANTAESGDSLIADPHVLPATMVTHSAGKIIEAYVNSVVNPVVELLLPASTLLGAKVQAPAIADFSSRGPTVQTPQLLKPDVVAPGVSILAAWPSDASVSGFSSDPRRAKFNIISGTSMACPHISGLGALLRSAHPTWSPAAIRSALMTTATNEDNAHGVITDGTDKLKATPYAYGAGIVRPQKALNPGLIYDLTPQDHIKFLCASGYTARQMKAFTHSKNPCPVKPMRIEDLNYPSFVAQFTPQDEEGYMTATFHRTLTNVGPAHSHYTSSIHDAPTGYHISVKPQTLSFRAKHEKRSFTLTVTVPNSPLPQPGALDTAFSYLHWEDGVHVVRSPIAIAKQG